MCGWSFTLSLSRAIISKINYVILFKKLRKEQGDLQTAKIDRLILRSSGSHFILWTTVNQVIKSFGIKFQNLTTAIQLTVCVFVCNEHQERYSVLNSIYTIKATTCLQQSKAMGTPHHLQTGFIISGGFRGVRGVQMHPPLVASNVFLRK